MESLQILGGRGFPEMETAAVLRRGDKGKLDARAEAEDSIAGDLEDAVYLRHDFMLLAATVQERNDRVGIQQETQTVCPLKETGFLPGTRGRPRWASTCFLNSSEEIERREDRISCIRCSLMSGRTMDSGLSVAFTGHEESVSSAWQQAGFGRAVSSPLRPSFPEKDPSGQPAQSAWTAAMIRSAMCW